MIMYNVHRNVTLSCFLCSKYLPFPRIECRSGECRFETLLFVDKLMNYRIWMICYSYNVETVAAHPVHFFLLVPGAIYPRANWYLRDDFPTKEKSDDSIAHLSSSAKYASTNIHMHGAFRLLEQLSNERARPIDAGDCELSVIWTIDWRTVRLLARWLAGSVGWRMFGVL